MNPEDKKPADIKTDNIPEATIIPITEHTQPGEEEEKGVAIDTHASTSEADEQITVSKKQLAHLIDRKRELEAAVMMYEGNEDKMAEIFQRAMKAFNLLDPDGEPVQELKTGDGVLGRIISAVKDKVSITEWMWNKKEMEQRLAGEFSFFSELLPMFEQYHERKQRRSRLSLGASAGNGTENA